MTDSLTDNFKSRDASASKNGSTVVRHLDVSDLLGLLPQVLPPVHGVVNLLLKYT